jgi:hypothetical protein
MAMLYSPWRERALARVSSVKDWPHRVEIDRIDKIFQDLL